LHWSLLTRITSRTSMEAAVDWVSLNNEKIVINTDLPL
jgi:hypothetical protein